MLKQTNPKGTRSSRIKVKIIEIVDEQLIRVRDSVNETSEVMFVLK